MEKKTEMETKSIIKLAKQIGKLETEIFNIEMKSSFGGDSYHGNYIFELLKKAEVNEFFPKKKLEKYLWDFENVFLSLN